jgi:hypothetical protein
MEVEVIHRFMDTWTAVAEEIVTDSDNPPKRPPGHQ